MKQQADDDGRVKGPMTFQLCLADHSSHVRGENGLEAEDGVNPGTDAARRDFPQAKIPR